MTILKFEPAPEGNIWDDNALKFFLKSDFPNTIDGIKNWINLLDEEPSTENLCWKYLEKSRFLTIEEYVANLHKELQVTELREALEKFQQLARQGNVALAEKNLNNLRLVLQAYETLLTELFPDYAQKSGMVFENVIFE